MASPFRNFAFGFLAAVLLAATFVSAASSGAPGSAEVPAKAGSAADSAKAVSSGLTLYNMNKYGFYSTDEDTVKFTYKIGEKEEATFEGFAPFLNLPNEGKLGNEIGVVSLSGCEVASEKDTTGICALAKSKLGSDGGFVAKLDASKKTLSIGLKNPTAAATPVKATAATAGLITFVFASASTAGEGTSVATTAATAVETTVEDTGKMAQIAAAGYLYSLADGSHFFTLEGYDCKDKGSDEYVIAVACSKKLQAAQADSKMPVVFNPEVMSNFRAMFDAALVADAKQGIPITVTQTQILGAPGAGDGASKPLASQPAQEPPNSGAAEKVEITALYTDGSDGFNVDKAKDKLFLNFKLSTPCKADAECTYSLKIGTSEILKDAKLKGSDKLERHITISLTKEQKAALKTSSPEAIMALKRKDADTKSAPAEGKATVKITETAETKKPKVGAPAPEKKPAKSVPSSGSGSGSGSGGGSGSPSGGSSIKDDSKCTAARGTCKNGCASNCGGGTCEPDKCTGASSRQCCVPKVAAPKPAMAPVPAPGPAVKKACSVFANDPAGCRNNGCRPTIKTGGDCNYVHFGSDLATTYCPAIGSASGHGTIDALCGKQQSSSGCGSISAITPVRKTIPCCQWVSKIVSRDCVAS